MALVGIIVVLISVAGGFLMAGGPLPVLIQPSEFVVIVGAAIGTLLTSSPGRMRARVMKTLSAAFKDATPGRADYLQLLRLQYDLFSLMRREGLLALEPHLGNPAQSPIFSKYPAVLKDHHSLVFFVEALQQVVNGVSPDDLDQLLETEIDTAKEEGHLPTGLITKIGDSLPGIGIVAAVLGIIVTMGHMDAPPAVIGKHVAAALVGTFLGILLCYGILGPLATNVEHQEVHLLRYMQCMRQGLVAAVRGSAPAMAVEVARKAIFSDDRPSFKEVDAALRGAKGG
jgi:chemotaxis protein MotA